MKQVKANKSLVWLKTYGKPFVKRRMIAKVNCASICAVAASQISLIKSMFSADKSGKALAIYKVHASSGDAMIRILKQANKGFVNPINKLESNN